MQDRGCLGSVGEQADVVMAPGAATGVGGTMANCHEGKVQSDKSLRSNAETHSRFLRGRKAGGESEFSSIFRLFKGLGKYISHQCCTPPPLSQAPPQVIK